MQKSTISNQLKLLVVIPMAIILIALIIHIANSYGIMNKSNKLLKDTEKIQQIVSLICTEYALVQGIHQVLQPFYHCR